MKLLTPIIFLFFSWISAAHATNYYFSSSEGNDGRSINQATNPATPWQSIKKINEVFSFVKPGDSILLRRGDSFFGTISITASGTEKQPIVIGAYGKGEQPEITGFQKISRWKNLGNGIFESNDPIDYSEEINIVVGQNRVLPIGRYPNLSDPNSGYLKIASHIGKNSITSATPLIPALTGGADIVVRTSQYTIDKATVISRNINSFTFGSGLTYEPKEGFGFFIQNHPATLDQNGEWYFDIHSGKLQVYFEDNPTDVWIPLRNNLVVSQASSFIKFLNIALVGCNKNAMDFGGPGSNLHIANCEISFAGQDGIYSKKLQNLSIDFCNIHDILNSGINVSENSKVSNSSVRNTGNIAGMTQNNAGIAAISNGGDGSITTNNTINRTGYIGIKFGRNNSIVKNNVIDSFCLIKQDGGAIYAQGKKGEKYSGTLIASNIVSNGIASGTGTTSSNNNSVGIYADDFLNNLIIQDNTVRNAGVGYYLHNTHDILVEKNKSFDNARVQFQIRSDKSDYLVRNISVINNQFVSFGPKQAMYYFTSLSDDLLNWGSFSENQFASETNDAKNFKIKIGRQADRIFTYHSFGVSYGNLISGSKYLSANKNGRSRVVLMTNDSFRQKNLTVQGEAEDFSGKKISGTVALKQFSTLIIFQK